MPHRGAGVLARSRPLCYLTARWPFNLFIETAAIHGSNPWIWGAIGSKGRNQRSGSSTADIIEGEDTVADAEDIVSGMAGRYAGALFSLAKESRAIDAVAADLKSFSALIDSNPDLQLLVKSPVFSAQDQTRALGKILEAMRIDGLASRFLLLVASKRRLFAVKGMIANFLALDDADRGVSRAEVTVAEPLSQANFDVLTSALRDVTGGKSVEIDVKVDPEILGGLVVRLGSRMVDGSLKTKLNSLRTRMKEVG